MTKVFETQTGYFHYCSRHRIIPEDTCPTPQTVPGNFCFRMVLYASFNRMDDIHRLGNHSYEEPGELYTCEMVAYYFTRIKHFKWT